MCKISCRFLSRDCFYFFFFLAFFFMLCYNVKKQKNGVFYACFFRDDGRAMACVVFTEEIGDMDTVPINNFTADNVVFAMKSEFSAANDTNTMN